MRSGYAVMKIQDAIDMLNDEMRKGAKSVMIRGTLLTSLDNTVILSSEKQM